MRWVSVLGQGRAARTQVCPKGEKREHSRNGREGSFELASLTNYHSIDIGTP